MMGDSLRDYNFAPRDPETRELYLSLIPDEPCRTTWCGKYVSRSCGYCANHSDISRRNKPIHRPDRDQLLKDSTTDDMDDSSDDESEKKNKKSHSTTLNQVPKNFYPHLLDYLTGKGWRRCGDMIYHPIAHESCCPQYQIRLKASNAVLLKKHKTCKKRLAKYLMMMEKGQDIQSIQKETAIEHRDDSMDTTETTSGSATNTVDTTMKETFGRIASMLREVVLSISKTYNLDNSLTPTQEMIEHSVSFSKFKADEISSNLVHVWSGISRKYYQQRLKEDGMNDESKGVEEIRDASRLSHLILSTLATLFNGQLNNDTVEMNADTGIRTVYTQNNWINFTMMDSQAIKDSKERFMNLKHKMPTKKAGKQGKASLKTKSNEQMNQTSNEEIHSSLPSDVDKYIQSQIVTELQLASFDEESYEIYKKYQCAIHKDKESKITPEGYKRFLIESCIYPVQHEKLPFGGFGTYHYKYRLASTNQLLGVSVVDILPTGWSSVYFFYDPAFKHLNLGTYSIIHEIDLITKMNQKFPDFEYLYLGLYIHSCRKMWYKADFQPSEMLCPDTHTWVPYDIAAEKIESGELKRFQTDLSIPSVHTASITDLLSVNVEFGELECNALILYSVLAESSKKVFLPTMLEFVESVGDAVREIIVTH